MTICGGSYPASQGEHLLAHYVGMMAPPGLPATLHGEEVGVCAVAMAALQQTMLARDRPPVVQPSAVSAADVRRRFGAAGAACWREVAPKLLDRAAADAVNARLARAWDTIRDRLAAVALGPARLRATLAAAGAPTSAEQLGWPSALFADARAHARELRDRYTFLDLAADAGLRW